MNEDIIARKLLIEQIRKELIDEMRPYFVGIIVKGKMICRKNVDLSNGRLFILPDNKYEELFGQ